MHSHNDKYLNKYIKYKNKYLELFNSLEGGSDHKIVVLDFCIKRQFMPNPSFSGTKILDKTPEEFVSKINNILSNTSTKLTDGELYSFAPHIFIDKDTLKSNGLDLNLVLNDIPITKNIESLIKSDYVSRNEKELKILTRWIDKKDINISAIPSFNFIDIVLYTKEHLLKEINERIEKGTASEADIIDQQKLEDPSITHGVVKILGTLDKKETPIDPITMIRNHLGMKFGGNGEEINLIKYLESVDYWSKNVLLK
jgi:hypothetical protein